jgi:putative transposase
MDFLPFDPELEVIQSRRNLPHWEQPGRTVYVTFRLGDSIPKSKLDQWKSERDTWIKTHPQPWTDQQKKEYQTQFVERIERWSDAGYGACHLKDPEVRGIVPGALEFFDSKRYDLGTYVIMPNHVHLLVTPREPYSLGEILHSWKSYTSNKINAFLGRRGTLWMDERFDHVVRSKAHLDWYRRYIAENPAKAVIPAGEYSVWEKEVEEPG